jgi:hypothetical protein
VHPHRSLVGIVRPALTAGAMFALAAGKARTVLVGLILNAAGPWWADPGAAFVIVS